mgnify:FL=1|jgi:hypothetical protein
MQDQQNMMAIEMMSGLSSFRAPARKNDKDSSLNDLPRIRFPNYSLRQVRKRSQTNTSATSTSPGSSATTPSPRKFDDSAQEWTPSTSGSTCYVLIRQGTIDSVGGTFKPNGRKYRTFYSRAFISRFCSLSLSLSLSYTHRVLV